MVKVVFNTKLGATCL